jgi:hypothetical protein
MRAVREPTQLLLETRLCSCGVAVFVLFVSTSEIRSRSFQESHFMPATITWLPAEPIGVVTVSRPFDPVAHPREVAQFLAEAMPKVDSPRCQRPSVIRKHAPPMSHVSDSEIFRFSAKNADQNHVGGAEVEIFATLDEALAHARAEIAALKTK